jgi:hypothetical protein
MEQINIKVDRLAKKALKAAHCTRQFIRGTFPYTQIWVTMGGKKVTGPLHLELGEFWGCSTTRRFFNKKGITLSAHFDTVWGTGYDWAISGYPKLFRSFITKQVSGWCGCNSKLSLWEEDIVNKCLQCGSKHENSKHLTQCRDLGWVLQLQNSIETIMDVLDKANVASKLTDMIKTYLLNQGRRSMVDCTLLASRFLLISIDVDNLGWDCFMEGIIPYSLIVSIKPMLLQYNTQGSVKNWGANLSQSLLSFTHKQWLYQNSNVHYVSEGLTVRQHDEVQAKIYNLMRTKQSALLPWHQHFLTIDFVKLGRGPTLARQVWVANMEMAISVFKVARGNFCTQESLCLLRTLLDTPISQPLPSTQTKIASSTNNSQQIRPHSTWFAASSHGPTVQLPRAPYTKHCNHNHPSSCTNCLSLSPTSLQRKQTPMSKTPHQLFPLFYQVSCGQVVK